MPTYASSRNILTKWVRSLWRMVAAHHTRTRLCRHFGAMPPCLPPTLPPTLLPTLLLHTLLHCYHASSVLDECAAAWLLALSMNVLQHGCLSSP